MLLVRIAAARRWLRRRPVFVDGVFAAAWFVLGGLHLVFPDAGWEEAVQEPYRSPNVFAWLCLALICIPTAWRRRYPTTVFIASITGVVLMVAGDFLVGLVPLLGWILMFGVGAYATSRRAAGAYAYAVGALVVAYATDYPNFKQADVARNAAIYGAVLAAGLFTAANRRSAAARLELAEQRGVNAAQRVHTALVEQRLRLAQELHDIMAHSMSVISVQAAMGTAAFSTRPDDSRRALANIERTSRETLSELRSLLGVLRDDDGRAELAPAPSLRNVITLKADMENAGVAASFAVEGTVDLPPAVDAFGYRIVQEALTNVLKHAHATHVAVDVLHEPGSLTIRVKDDGRGHPGSANGSGSGHGLIGMRERVAMYGGSLRAAAAPGGGFEVVATLPYADQYDSEVAQ